MNHDRQAEAAVLAARPPPARRASLRLRLLLLAAVALAIALGLVGFALDRAFYRSSEMELRSQMETWVYLTLGATDVSGEGVIRVQDDLGDPRLSQPNSGIYVHVHGTVDHWNSPSSLGLDLPELEAAAAGEVRFRKLPEPPGLLVFQYGVGWELPDESVIPFTVTVLADPVLLDPKISAFRRGLWRLLGAAGLILALAQFLFLALALRPLRGIARDVAAIESGAREHLGGPYPRELEPLTRNLDRLLATEKANRERYRSALDSLAHSLKTPLAVIRAGLSRGDGLDAGAMHEAVDDMQHLIASRLQRAAASTRRTLAAPVPVAPLTERLLASMKKIHSHKLQRADVSIAPRLVFSGEERDLMELMGNLLDNAIKYGAGRVRLTAGALESGRRRGGLWICVENDGKPIAGDRKARLLERGVRGDERIEGHGLGLTIVMELVTAYGGEIAIEESELGGASVTVRIPPA